MNNKDFKIYKEGYKIGFREGLDYNLDKLNSFLKLESFNNGLLIGVIIGSGLMTIAVILFKSFGSLL
jgi:hypothetical protein